MDETHFTVGTHDAMVNFIGALTSNCGLDAQLDGITVIGMNTTNESVVVSGEFLRGKTENAICLIRPPQIPGGNMPCPCTNVAQRFCFGQNIALTPNIGKRVGAVVGSFGKVMPRP